MMHIKTVTPKAIIHKCIKWLHQNERILPDWLCMWIYINCSQNTNYWSQHFTIFAVLGSITDRQTDGWTDEIGPAKCGTVH